MGGKTSSIMDALSLSSREMVVLVGGGGKTGLLLALIDETRSAGLNAAATTTTRVAAAEAEAVGKVFCCGFDEAGFKWLPRPSAAGLFIGSAGLGSGKIAGISPEAVDLLFSEYPVDYLVVEADGAAGMPLKAPALHEPVIPSSATLVVAVMGLEVVGRPLSGQSAFRMDRVEAVTGLKCGDMVTPESLVPLFLSPSGLFKGCPAGVRRVVLLNKSDLPVDEAAARSLGAMILSGASGGVERVIVGSLARRSFNVISVRGGEGTKERGV